MIRKILLVQGLEYRSCRRNLILINIGVKKVFKKTHRCSMMKSNYQVCLMVIFKRCELIKKRLGGI